MEVSEGTVITGNVLDDVGKFADHAEKAMTVWAPCHDREGAFLSDDGVAFITCERFVCASTHGSDGDYLGTAGIETIAANLGLSIGQKQTVAK